MGKLDAMIEIGDTVRLKRRLRGERNSKVTALVDQIIRRNGGGVRLNRPLKGEYLWQMDDLEIVQSRPLKRSG